MSVESGDEVIFFRQLAEEDEVILFSERGWAKRIPQMDFESQNRSGKGVRCFSFNKNGSNGRFIAGVCILQESVSGALLVSQFRSPITRLNRDEILLQGRSGRGMPYIMAILDDVVTGVTPVALSPEPSPSGEAGAQAPQGV